VIAIVGGGLTAAKVVEGYRAAGGQDDIRIWSQDPHGPYHRPGLSKRVLRGEAEPESVLAHPLDWYGDNGVDLRLGESIGSLDDVDAETVVIATGARPRTLDDARLLRTMDDSIALHEAATHAETKVSIVESAKKIRFTKRESKIPCANRAILTWDQSILRGSRG